VSGPAACPVCSSLTPEVFLRRGGVPVHQNLIFDDPASAVATPRGDLAFACCQDCGFVFNQAFSPALLSYGPSYDNSQMHSPAFREHVRALADHLLRDRGLRGARILEVGCGRGDFLELLAGAPDTGNLGLGFDPSHAGPDTSADGRIRYFRRYFTPREQHVRADAAVCRHVIEHVPDPLELALALREGLSSSERPRVFLETPCVEWILRNCVFWDFFYEHCSLFSERSMEALLRRAGFAVTQTRHVFGGQYLWTEAELSGYSPYAPDGGRTLRLAREYAGREDAALRSWEGRLAGLREAGKVALWGAGAKGAAFANLLDPACELIECVVDLNPNKQGRFLPGTGHPIVGFRELGERGVPNAVLMNPNYRMENQDLLDRFDIHTKLVW